MSKKEIKQLIIIIIIGFINIEIAFSITSLCGITNTIIIKTFTVINNEITWEVIIFWILSLIEASGYKYIIIDRNS